MKFTKEQVNKNIIDGKDDLNYYLFIHEDEVYSIVKAKSIHEAFILILAENQEVEDYMRTAFYAMDNKYDLIQLFNKFDEYDSPLFAISQLTNLNIAEDITIIE